MRKRGRERRKEGEINAMMMKGENLAKDTCVK